MIRDETRPPLRRGGKGRGRGTGNENEEDADDRPLLQRMKGQGKNKDQPKRTRRGTKPHHAHVPGAARRAETREEVERERSTRLCNCPPWRPHEITCPGSMSNHSHIRMNVGTDGFKTASASKQMDDLIVRRVQQETRRVQFKAEAELAEEEQFNTFESDKSENVVYSGPLKSVLKKPRTEGSSTAAASGSSEKGPVELGNDAPGTEMEVDETDRPPTKEEENRTGEEACESRQVQAATKDIEKRKLLRKWKQDSQWKWEEATEADVKDRVWL